MNTLLLDEATKYVGGAVAKGGGRDLQKAPRKPDKKEKVPEILSGSGNYVKTQRWRGKLGDKRILTSALGLKSLRLKFSNWLRKSQVPVWTYRRRMSPGFLCTEPGLSALFRYRKDREVPTGPRGSKRRSLKVWLGSCQRKLSLWQ